MSNKIINKKDLLLYSDKNDNLLFGGDIKEKEKKITKISKKNKKIIETDNEKQSIKEKIKQKKNHAFNCNC